MLLMLLLGLIYHLHLQDAVVKFRPAPGDVELEGFLMMRRC